MQKSTTMRIPLVRYSLLSIAIVCVARFPLSLPAQENHRAPEAKSYRDRVCDFAILSEGKRVTGIAINSSPARIVIRTDRLKAEAPELFTNEILPLVADKDRYRNQELINILQPHAEQLKSSTPVDLQQAGLMDEIIERLETRGEHVPPWIVLEIAPKRLKRLETLPANRREFAKLALLNQINDFENLHWKTVAARLQAIPEAQLKRPVATPPQPTPPKILAERILAAIDVRLNRCTRLIQTGEHFVNEHDKPDLATLLTMHLGNSLTSTIQELLNESGGSTSGKNVEIVKLPEAAIQIAQENGNTTVVVSSFTFDTQRGTATVMKQLFKESTPRQWTHIDSTITSSTTNDVTPEQIRKINEDPQVTEISELLRRLSPDPSALKTAIQMGAVVQNALSKGDAAFQASLQKIIAAGEADESPPTVVLKAVPVKSCPACGDAE
jgi:hypothetical protein